MNTTRWTEWFEWFHAHPETGCEEHETTGKIREILQEFSVEIVPSDLPTGLLAVIRGGRPGPVRALRADIDALPVREETELSYRSLYEGRMHACGHDFHMTSVLAAAELLQAEREQLKGTVWLVFQPAEEVFTGARQVVQTGLLTGVEQFWGIHADPDLDSGVVGIHAGPIAASVDRYRIDVTGIGCHGALPHLGKSPLTVLSGLVSDLDAFARRSVSPFRPSVVSVTQMHGGDTWNVIPKTAFLEGTVRTFDENDRTAIHEAILRITEGAGIASGTECVLTWTEGHDPVINDPDLSEYAKKTAVQNGFAWQEVPAAMVGDDFGFYSKTYHRPGAYLKIGIGQGHNLHHPAFRVDPSAIAPTASFLKHLLMGD